MISLDQLGAYWRNLLSEAQGLGPDSAYPVQEIREVQLPAGFPLLASDALGQRHLLLPIPQGVRTIKDQRSTGVQLAAAEWRSDSGEPVRVVDIVCRKPHLNDLFDLIILDVLNGLAEGAARPDAVGRRVLDRWRELLSHEPAEMPDKAIIIGMLGELLMLERLAALHPDALTCWTGPNGARHDFSGRRAALEVKSTLRTHGLVLTINGLTQFQPPPDSALHLAVSQFEEAPQDGVSVGQMVERLVEAGVDRAALLERMAKVGFTPEVIAKIGDQRFRLLALKQYTVDDSFPRIVPASFVGGAAPSGVVGLTYEIDLSAAPPYPLSEEQAQQFLVGFMESNGS